MDYYREVSPWTLNGERISVVKENEHLGLVVSGRDEEEKNVDSNIQDCRQSLLGLLGPAFAFKCLLPPSVKIHLWRTYNLPVLCSGLSALPIRPTHMKSITIFHNKMLRGFLQLSQTSPIPALHFLLGELPVEARLHMDIMSLFYNIWANQETTIFKIVQYLFKMSNEKSTTWSAHVRLLCMKYQLPDPLLLLSEHAWPKDKWTTLVKTRITVHTENQLREKSRKNSKMIYLNVQLAGLTGTQHIALCNIYTTQDALRLRYHLKFLTGDYLTAERQSIDQGTSPRCKLCPAEVESVEHVLTKCLALRDVHSRLLPELLNVVHQVQPLSSILANQTRHLTQFILDCTSINLPQSYRVPAHNPRVSEVFKISRDWCYAAGRHRLRLLKDIK